MRHLAVSFPPVTAKKPLALILGSMPGLPSLKAGEYYGHRPNMFWPVMARIFDEPIDTYDLKLDIIRSNGLALWDVLKHCERTGSSDSKIHKGTEEANDFTAFFRKHPSITRVYFNGGTAEAMFKKHVMPELTEKTLARLDFTRLPSTSPLHTVSLEKKLKEWRQIRP